MNKRYIFTAPTPDRCVSLGLKSERLTPNMVLWMLGVSAGVSYISGIHFKVVSACHPLIVVDTDSTVVLNNVKDHVESYRFTCTERQIISDEKILTSGDLKD